MSDSNADYSQVELEAIHRAIAPPPPPAPSEVLATMEVPVPEWMRPFWKLVDLEPELFVRLATDPWVRNAIPLRLLSAGVGVAHPGPPRPRAAHDRPHPRARGHPALRR